MTRSSLVWGLLAVVLLGPGALWSAAQEKPDPAERPSRSSARPGERGHFRGAPPEAEVSIELIQELIEIIGLFRPELAHRFKTDLVDRPGEVRKALRPHLPLLVELLHLRRNDPQMFNLRIEELKLDVAAEELARQVRRAEDDKDAAQAQEGRKELKAKLEEQFKLRQKVRQIEIDRLQAELDRMKDQLAAREKAKDSLIQEQIEKLTGNPPPEW